MKIIMKKYLMYSREFSKLLLVITLLGVKIVNLRLGILQKFTIVHQNILFDVIKNRI